MEKQQVGEALVFIQLENCGACDYFYKKYWNNSYMLKYLYSKNIKPMRYMLSTKDKKIIPKRITSFFEKGMMFPTFMYVKNFTEFMNEQNNNIHCYGYKLGETGQLVPDINTSPNYDTIMKWLDKSLQAPFPLYNPKSLNKRTIVVEVNKNYDEIYRE